MTSNSKKSLLHRIRRGKAVRQRLVENNLAEGIAFQIAATRDARGWSQADLAREAGIANNLPRLENPDYGKQTITTLKKLAAALDVALVVRLVPFSQYIDWLSGTKHLDSGLRPEALAVPSFEDEEKVGACDAQVDYWPVLKSERPITNTGIITPVQQMPRSLSSISDAYIPSNNLRNMAS